MAAPGKRAAERPKQRLPKQALIQCAGATAAVIIWVLLVWAAIELGSRARGGESALWALTALATLGAIAALFAGLMLGAAAFAALATPPSTGPDTPAPHPGGKRAAR